MTLAFRAAQAVLALPLCLCSSLVAFGAEPSAAARNEIAHLLNYVERSGCQFYRNDDWHSSAKARSHLTKKYTHLLRMGLIKDSEDFIRLAATKSSVSGKQYRVWCKGSAPVISEAWLREELERYRKQNSAKKRHNAQPGAQLNAQ